MPRLSEADIRDDLEWVKDPETATISCPLKLLLALEDLQECRADLREAITWLEQADQEWDMSRDFRMHMQAKYGWNDDV